MNVPKVFLREFLRLTGWALMLGQVVPGTGWAQSSALIERYMTVVPTELVGKVDTKNAVAGQALVVVTKRAVTLADGRALPQGTRIVGRVVEARGVSETQTGSVLVMVFDTADLGGGKVLPVRSMMRAVSPAGMVVAPSDGMSAEQRGAPGTGGMPGLGGNSSGMGGTQAGRRAGGAYGSAGTSRQPTLGPATIPTDPVVSQSDRTTAQGGETVGSAPLPTGIAGVLLANRLRRTAGQVGDVSGALIGSGRNVRLEGGTVIVLGVIGR